MGCDPGQRTGIAFVMADNDAVILMNTKEIYGGVEGFVAWWEDARTALTAVPMRIICESFTLREGKSGIDTTPLEVIGALVALCERDSIDLKFRSPSGRLKQMPDRAMKNMGMYLTGRANRNAKEAIRHVLAELKSQRHPAVLAAFLD